MPLDPTLEAELNNLLDRYGGKVAMMVGVRDITNSDISTIGNIDSSTSLRALLLAQVHYGLQVAKSNNDELLALQLEQLGTNLTRAWGLGTSHSSIRILDAKEPKDAIQ